ncbi:S-layer homology domain-containing protein [Peptoniphilus catoniae]|uniref:S-layer homology domain-containing protein n=1 Tax=Peptoniphilus catoniae TaxID=1660341 RepID=UPI0010FEBED1|nr:S-layer homology domain-containing protein [Peptoniphilus catoniae]
MNKKLGFIYAFILVFIMIVSVPSYGMEDISVVLEQPAVYKAEKGDNLDYKLNIKLPENYENRYRSFAVTLLLDKNLKVTSADFVGVKAVDAKLVLNITNIKDETQNLVTVSVNDADALAGVSNFGVDIKTQVKEASSGDSFENSFVVTYVDREGKENSIQKNLTSNTKVEDGKLALKSFYSNEKILRGSTQPGANLTIIEEGKDNINAVADKDGKIAVEVGKKEVGTKLIVKSEYMVKDKKYSAEDTLVVKPAEDKYITDNIADKSLISSEEANITILQDHVDMARKINVFKAGREDSARLGAAVANGQYVLVKSDVKGQEISDAIKKIKEATTYLRKPLMQGYADANFGCNKKMTRAEVASVLARIKTGEEPRGNFSSFKDVDQDKWYADAVGYMEKEGIFGGYSDNTFKPEKSITRAEFAAVISKLTDSMEKVPAKEFKDVDEDHWAKTAIDHVTSRGYMRGRSENQFAPDAAITRAEVAVVLNKLTDRVPDKEFMDKYSKNPFKDLSKDFWAYYEILEVSGN